MIQIKDKIVSFDVVQQCFACDLSKCKGICCVEGEYGAPLDENELQVLIEIFEEIKPFMREEGIAEILKQGAYVLDDENKPVTPLIEGMDCAYSIKDNDITKCAIEKAFFEGKTKFRKPISCHLFPIRIHKYKEFDGLNYNRVGFCKPARESGEAANIRVHEFVKDALIRAYGEEWYNELSYAADNMKFEKQ